MESDMASVGFSSGVTATVTTGAGTGTGTGASTASSARDAAATGGSTQGADATSSPAPASTVVTVSSLQAAADAQDPKSTDGGSPAKAKPRAQSEGEAIGSQMVLVFDDQAHAMTVKMLDIETQKVPQELPGAPGVSTPAALASSSTSTATAGVPAPGAYVNTKA